MSHLVLVRNRSDPLPTAPIQINSLVAEFAVLDWQESLEFYTKCLEFKISFQRPDEGFVFLEFEGAQVMFYQANLERNLVTDQAPLERPLGRGVNLQIQTKSIEPLVQKLERTGVDLSFEPEERWYRVGEFEIGVLQFAVADPDGYLLRFSEAIGSRAASR
ncbi:VOC family protein [uncultured Ruegeria sp.]|uniref:bleomycin resistance protein n=1 Tax=uncultured Ruegeria sp. TaxID=259304 RepID=UPI0026138276|nr:VOC family protein [uncultured Ruegeria sp.]